MRRLFNCNDATRADQGRPRAPRGGLQLACSRILRPFQPRLSQCRGEVPRGSALNAIRSDVIRFQCHLAYRHQSCPAPTGAIVTSVARLRVAPDSRYAIVNMPSPMTGDAFGGMRNPTLSHSSVGIAPDYATEHTLNLYCGDAESGYSDAACARRGE